MTPKFELDRSSFDRRTIIFIFIGVTLIIGLIVVLVTILGGGDSTPAEEISEVTDTPLPTLPLQPTLTAPPTETVTLAPTATLAPYTHQVQSGETLLFIIQLYGYRDLAVIPDILLLNGMISENDLFEGQDILIPQQTPTPAPTPIVEPDTDTSTEAGDPPPDEADSATAPPDSAGATGDYRGCSPDDRCVSLDGAYWVHEIIEGDTIAGLAFAYYSRVQDICDANNLNCNNPIISIGNPVFIPILITSTPTLTPTGGPDSTATPLPTLRPPSLAYPIEGTEFARSDQVVLQWVAINPLLIGQYYLVIVRNLETDEEFKATTRSNTYRLPSSLQPPAGGSIRYEWRVVIVNGRDSESQMVSGQNESWEFIWGS